MDIRRRQLVILLLGQYAGRTPPLLEGSSPSSPSLRSMYWKLRPKSGVAPSCCATFLPLLLLLLLPALCLSLALCRLEDAACTALSNVDVPESCPPARESVHVSWPDRSPCHSRRSISTTHLAPPPSSPCPSSYSLYCHYCSLVSPLAVAVCLSQSR